MAFPTIPTVGAGRVLSAVQANATSPRTFPNLSSLTKNSGDLLIALIGVYDATATAGAAFATWGGSFTEFADLGSTGNIRFGAAYKVSTGTETGTFTVAQTTPTGHAVMFLLSIPGAHTSAAPEAGGLHAVSNAVANPASVSPSWGADDTLWIGAACSGETATAGAFDTITAGPSGYSSLAVSTLSGDTIGGVWGAVAFRQANTASEDAGAWAMDTSNARNGACTIAVRPAPAVPNYGYIRRRPAHRFLTLR